MNITLNETRGTLRRFEAKEYLEYSNDNGEYRCEIVVYGCNEEEVKHEFKIKLERLLKELNEKK